MKLTVDSLSGHLQGTLASTYLVSGDDPLRVGESADAIRQTARERGFTEREVHFVERSTDWAAIRASTASLSLFGERKIVELRMPTGKPGTTGASVISELIEAEIAEVLLLIITGRLDRTAANSPWARAVQQQGAWLPIWDLSAEDLPGWLAVRCRHAGFVADPEALELLALRVEGNLLAAQQEIDKLRLLVEGSRLTAGQVLEAVADSSRFDVFRLGEAALAGEPARALQVLSGLRSEGVEPTLVLWALNRELRSLWTLNRGGTVYAHAGSAQSRGVEAARRRAGRLPFARLCSRASRADRVIKGRLRGDAWEELRALTVELCGLRVLPVPAMRRG